MSRHKGPATPTSWTGGMSRQDTLLGCEEDICLQQLDELESGPVPPCRHSTSGDSDTVNLMYTDPAARKPSLPASAESCMERPPCASKGASVHGAATGWEDHDASLSRFQLPPKILQRRKRGRKRFVYTETLFMFALAILCGVLGAKSLHLSVDVDSIPAPDKLLVRDRDYMYSAGNCDGASATGIESGFVVDFYAARDLSFTQAKLLDLAWDTLIGQGLKLVHCWVLYKVVANYLTSIMEVKAVPHNAYLDLHFSTVSFASLRSSFAFIRKPFRRILFALWLIPTIAYLLCFTVVWSAVTGYTQASIPTYSVSGFQSISAESPELTLCWVLQDPRVTAPGTSKIIPGPSFAETFGGFSHLRTHSPFEKLDPLSHSYPREMDDFLEVYSYFLTKRLNSALISCGNLSVGWSDLNVLSDKGLEDIHLGGNDFKDFKLGGNDLCDTRHLQESLQAASDIGGWEFARSARVPVEERVQFRGLSNDSIITARKARFLRNDSMGNQTNLTSISEPSFLLPYNSTLWLDGRERHLAAPFLNVAPNCSKVAYRGLGVCLCLNGAPVDEPIDTDTPTGCHSTTGYSWGFSRIAAGSALLVEALWIFWTWCMWVYPRYASPMVVMGRLGSGRIRIVLDAAEAITRLLGDQHSAYTDGELAQRLESSPPLGYRVEQRNEEVQHIGLRPILQFEDREASLRKRVKFDSDTLYG